MSNKIYISIPKPCGENWNTMISSEKGKFCASCQKNVIDFTTFSDREVLKYYNQNSKICGRFTNTQLNRNLIVQKEKNSIWLAVASAIVSFLGLGSQEVYSQESIKTEQTDSKIQTDTIKKTKNKIAKKISGIVTDGKVPLPGVTIFIKGSTHRTQTDIDGNYSIEAKKEDILIFSYIGFESVKEKISRNNKVNIAMKEEAAFLGEVIIQEN